jgi:hypothetical protein
MVIEVRPELAKVSIPIDASDELASKKTLLSDLAYTKAEFPIDVTELGIVMELIPDCKKAVSPIDVRDELASKTTLLSDLVNRKA